MFKSYISVTTFKQISLFLLILTAGIIIFFIIDNKINDAKVTAKQRPAELTAIKLVDKSCEHCFDMEELLTVLKRQNVVFKEIKEVDINSDEGKQLIADFNIIKVPVLLIKGEIDKDENFTKIWQGFGKNVGDTLVSDVFPPYKDLSSGQITGLIDLIILYDKTCNQCYNTKAHLAYLEAEGIYPASTKKLDISDPEAQALINKYNITKVPTIILSPEAKYYKRLADNWQTDGDVADDGYYIFRAPEKIGTYRDLTTNEIITP